MQDIAKKTLPAKDALKLLGYDLDATPGLEPKVMIRNEGRRAPTRSRVFYKKGLDLVGSAKGWIVEATATYHKDMLVSVVFERPTGPQKSAITRRLNRRTLKQAEPT